MKQELCRRCPALLAVFAVLLTLSVCGLAAAPDGYDGTVSGMPRVLSGYCLREAEETPDATVVRYADAAGRQLIVTYEPAGKEPLPRGVWQYYCEPLLYACYSEDSAGEQIGSVRYTVGMCAVNIASRSSSGQPLLLDRQTMLELIETLQGSPAPLPVDICASCGGAMLQQAADVGEWNAVSPFFCGHGGIFRYNDVLNERTVRLRAVCTVCRMEKNTAWRQEAVYCAYGQRWYVKTA